MRATHITGTTRLYAIIGDPIIQVRSPEVFTERFAAAGANAVLVPMHVPADRFDDVVRGLMGLGNLDGVLVTVPFKARMLPFASRLGPAAQIVGAINAVRKESDGSWTGDMFDGAGFVRANERRGHEIRGRRVLLFGAGGAGSAIACALASAGVRSIAIVDVDSARADSLARTVRGAFPACDSTVVESKPDGVDMIVNASPVGMRSGDGMPGEIGFLDSGTLVGDVIVSTAPTPIIEHAVRHGCSHVTGCDMLAGQVDAVVHFFAPASSAATAGGRPAA